MKNREFAVNQRFIYLFFIFTLAFARMAFAATLINNISAYTDKLSTATSLTRSIVSVPRVEILPDGSLRSAVGPLYAISGGAAGTPPAYGEWWRGCGPTSCGMLMGYWDTRGFDSLMPVDASIENNAVKSVIASQQHYDDYCLPLDDIAHSPVVLADKSTTGGAHANNCIADYLRTSWSVDNLMYGWTAFYTSTTAKKGIGYGIRTYTRTMNPTYDAIVTPKQWGSNISQGWTEFVAEIDAGYPVLILVDTNGDNNTDHIVPAFGYDTIGGVHKFACYNTWDTTIHWYDFVPMSPGVTWGIGFAELYHPKIKKVIRVSTTGNDANDGSSWGSAMRSVKAAVGTATISDEIWVAEGTYTGVNDSISINNDIHLYGGFAGTEASSTERNPSLRTTILSYEKGITFASAVTNECILDGFTIKTGNSWNAAYCVVGSAPIISNNKFDSGSAAVYSEGYPGPDVTNNVIIGTAQYGIYGVGNLIANNIISVPAGNGLNGGAAKIINNTITGCGIGVYTVTPTSLIANNIISFNSVGLWKSSDCAATLSKNCVYNNSTNYNVSVTPGASDIHVDPLLVNRAGGDYHLQSGSPCRDAGDDSAVTAGWRDIYGGNRLSGDHVDIGADELDVNHAPIANAQNLSMNKNATKSIALTGSDVDGDLLLYTVATSPAHGAITGSAPAITYTPTTGYTGTDSFTFKVNDGKVDSAPATVSITITEALSKVVLTTNLASPRIIGTTIILTATPTGGATVQYKFLDGVVILRDFAPGNAYSWLIPGDAAGVHAISVVARDIDASNPDATVTSSKSYTVAPALSAITMSCSPVNAVLIGNTVTLMATATGGANMQYQFMSGASLMRSFSSARTLTFIPAVEKIYNFTVIARDLNGIDPNATMTSAVVILAAKPALSAVTLISTPLNASLVGNLVTLTAATTGGANVQYQFMTGATLIRSFNSSNTYTFTPLAVKNYSFTVIARDLAGVDPNATVTSAVITLAIKPALSAVTAVTTPLNVVATNTTVTITATPAGGANVQYKFMAGASLLRSFNSSNTFSFTPAVVKTYSLTVIARDLDGADPNATVTSPAATLAIKAPLSAVSLTTSPLNTVTVGVPVTLTATATGGANVQYKFMAGASLMRSFASSNTYTFTPAAAKTYSFTVIACDLNSADPNLTYTSTPVTFVVTTP